MLQEFDFSDWAIVFAAALTSISFQICRFMANRYADPGQLSQYICLVSVYTLCFDLFIFNETFLQIQWIGFTILFIGYSYKFWTVYQNAQAKNKSDSEDDYKKDEMS